MPIVDGPNLGNTQVVTTNDGKGIAYKQVICNMDEKRSTIMKSMRQNTGLWWYSYLAVNLDLNEISLRRCMRCWSMGVQTQPMDFHKYSRSTMLMKVPPQLISHLGSHSASISTTLQTHVGQDIQNKDIDDILGGSVRNIQETIDAPIFDMQNVIQLGLFPPGKAPQRSAGGASVATKDTDVSETPSKARSTSMYNIEDAYKRLKEGNLKFLTKALASEKETAAVKGKQKAISKALAESLQREKKGKERRGERERIAKDAAQEEVEERDAIWQKKFEMMMMRQPIIMEQPKATAHNQSEVENDQMMNTPIAHSPAAVVIPPSKTTHSVRFNLDDETGAKKPTTGSLAPVEK